ncbi:MAG: hypothetical protein A3K19_23170 [Lentisphaerae bacterium RIFOXYB12_FULL_65_16]|nr:MAG: hypothetical protein A3K18_15680 [Lentisphaerae bacterium RIFOXYA12_64_32]OGV84946.1 MAG: hypothetical protein A3K19_23170 [Lentisphaerae bacterium RIFOXYB12_FULL_65_16]
MSQAVSENAIWFWSRLGFLPDPPGFCAAANTPEELGRFCRFHRQMLDAGIKVHTSILPSGWMGSGTYDYAATDTIMDALFDACPDILYVPRVKLNAPLLWQKDHPGELCVYYGGPETPDEIALLVGTPKHDILGYDSPAGQYGGKVKRPNVGGLICNQSFASGVWREDASQALLALVDHIQSGPHAKRVIGYHIGYGVSAESMVWGSWAGKFADYGPAAKKAFRDWGLRKYGSEAALSQAWRRDVALREFRLPSPDERKGGIASFEELFRTRPEHRIVIDYEEFVSEVNADHLISFCKSLKDKAGRQILAGGFYGYFAGLATASESGHVAIGRVLESPHVDFLAAPNSYVHRAPGDPGMSFTAEKSVALCGKVWINECDIRTHLSAPDAGCGRASSQEQTDAVMWRDFSRSICAGTQLWWMDLFGGWFDSPEILATVTRINSVLDDVRRRGTVQRAEMAFVIDERFYYHASSKADWHRHLLVDMGCAVRRSGLPVDFIRFADVLEGKAPDYRLLIFPASFFISDEERAVLRKRLAGRSALWLYAPGVKSPGFSLGRVAEIVGFEVRQSSVGADAEMIVETSFGGQFRVTGWRLPMLEVVPGVGVRHLARTAGGVVVAATVHHPDGYHSFYSSVAPLPPEFIRSVAREAGCHVYVEQDCAVDSCGVLLTVHAGRGFSGLVRFPRTCDATSVLCGRVWKQVREVDVSVGDAATLVLRLD